MHKLTKNIPSYIFKLLLTLSIFLFISFFSVIIYHNSNKSESNTVNQINKSESNTAISRGDYLIAAVSLLVCFLGLTGQYMLNKKKEQSEKSKNAQIIASDLESIIINIKNLYPNILEARSIDTMHVRFVFQENPISILPNWRSLALSIGCDLGKNELSLLLSTYSIIESIMSLSHHINDNSAVLEIENLFELLLVEDNGYKAKSNIIRLIQNIKQI